ncbi:DrmB family protein [Pseudomonas sp. NPDC007930]|uniref:DrmB family protein n=1 Tax=Pseudomonas sp. NPDC007930 TaxID=3364417 RepID=UPI0036EE039D
MASEIRLGQLIAPFGPGSIYTDKHGIPNIVCGLDFWHKQRDERGNWREDETAMRKHLIDEPRLSALLQVPRFRQPPEYCVDDQNPGLSRLEIQTHRFPTWYVDSLSGRMRRFNLETKKLAPLQKGEKAKWRPVRFISVCSHGHMADFPWKAWCGCTCPGDAGLVLNDSGGPDLRSVKVSCSACKKWKTLAGSMGMERNKESGKIDISGLKSAGIDCSGERPWLGRAAQPCQEPPVAVLINQSNIYFGKILSSIYLPDMTSEQAVSDIQKILRQNEGDLTAIKTLLSLHQHKYALGMLHDILRPHYSSLPDDDSIMKAMDSLSQGTSLAGSGPLPVMAESEPQIFRRSEYNVLRNEVGPGVDPELRVIHSRIPQCLKPWFGRINLVERLRETRVLCGFERLIRAKEPLESMPSSAMNQLFLHPPEPAFQWLPAIKNYGEGIFVELNEDAVRQWLTNNTKWLTDRLDQAFVERMANETNLMPPLQSNNRMPQWAARYLLVHSLAHILINQMVFECGYSSAALKERIFVSSDPEAPMAAFLIYTAAGDSEGSLGGLVRIGRPELFEPMVLRALSRASWCSADPVCSENLGGTGSRRVNKAACHACVLLPETACETVNSGLDRAMVVGTPEAPHHGFLTDLIHEAMTRASLAESGAGA